MPESDTRLPVIMTVTDSQRTEKVPRVAGSLRFPGHLTKPKVGGPAPGQLAEPQKPKKHE